jgi:hypothetical protein
MRKIILAGAVAAAALIGPAAAMAASDPGNGSFKCANATADYDSAETLQTIPGVITQNVVVPAGAICRLHGVTVEGNITVNSGGYLHTFGLTADKNVTVNAGGQFLNSNWGVTIDGDLSFTDPAAGSQNGFGTGNNDTVTNEIKGNLTYTIDPLTAYPMYDSPQLYFGSPTQVDKSFTYTDQGTGFQGHLDGLANLTVTGNKSITR